MDSTEREYIAKCREQIEEKLNWLNPGGLKQSDFQYLGDLVYEKTKTQLSLSTIKRFWDVSYNKSFQIGTLNALAQFLGYQNWHGFKEKNVKSGTWKLEIRTWRLVITASVLIFVASICYFLFFYKNDVSSNKKKPLTNNQVVFTSKKSVKEGVPNTIIFNYDASSLSSDSLCVQLSWNVKERFDIKKEDEYYTSTYYFPGYHQAKLVANNQVVKTHYVHITTKDWLTLVRYTPYDVLPIYIRNNGVISNGSMYASPYMLKTNNVDLTSREFYVSYFNVRDFGLDGDNFSFETQIKNKSLEPELLCQDCQIMVYAEHGSFVIPVSPKGCVSDIGIMASEVYKSGKTNDLSGFGCDLNDWRRIKCDVSNKKLSVFIDNQLACELSYSKPLGKIMGWHYFFKGCGAVDYLKLFDAAKNIVYQNDFTK